MYKQLTQIQNKIQNIIDATIISSTIYAVSTISIYWFVHFTTEYFRIISGLVIYLIGFATRKYVFKYDKPLKLSKGLVIVREIIYILTSFASVVYLEKWLPLKPSTQITFNTLSLENYIIIVTLLIFWLTTVPFIVSEEIEKKFPRKDYLNALKAFCFMFVVCLFSLRFFVNPQITSVEAWIRSNEILYSIILGSPALLTISFALGLRSRDFIRQ